MRRVSYLVCAVFLMSCLQVVAIQPEVVPPIVQVERVQLEVHNLAIAVQSMPAAPPALRSQVDSLQVQAQTLSSQIPASAAQQANAVQAQAADIEQEVSDSPTPDPSEEPTSNDTHPEGDNPSPAASQAPAVTTLGFDDVDFPNYTPCVGPAQNSVDAAVSDSTATRPAIKQIDDVSNQLLMAGFGTIASDVTGVGFVLDASKIADVARETAAYGVDTATANLTAHLLTLTKESDDLHRFFEEEHRYPKGTPEFERYRQMYDSSIRTHLVEEQALMPQGNTSWEFIRSAITSSPEIMMTEIKMVAKGASEIIVGKAIDAIGERAEIDPGKILPPGAFESVDTVFSRNAWRSFDAGKAGQKYLTKLLEDKITSAAVSTVFDKNGEPVQLFQYQHTDCVDASLVTYAAPPWKDIPIQAVIFAPAVVQNAPQVQVYAAVAAPVQAATPSGPTSAGTQAQQNVPVTSGSSANQSYTSPRGCEQSQSCQQLIQASSGPSIAASIFNGSGL
jgi:hypothetical protein